MPQELDAGQPQVPEKVERFRAPELDAVLGVAFPVLDDGFVRVVDYMGTDESIVQAARVSYGKGTKKINEDRGLIRYLLRHRHTTPFEMCEIKLHVRVPMDCWRQWIRHRTANVNEYSTRYSIAIDSTQRTAPDQWRVQATDSKQGSAGYLDKEKGARLCQREDELQKLARAVYSERLNFQVAREQARKDLPLSTYTEAYWKIDLHNLLHFVGLRMDAHAQLEIRDYATTMGEQILRRWCPVAWEAFLDYHFQSAHFSRIEMDILSAIGGNDAAQAKVLAAKAGWLQQGQDGYKRNRERTEFEMKLKQLNMKKPW